MKWIPKILFGVAMLSIVVSEFWVLAESKDEVVAVNAAVTDKPEPLGEIDESNVGSTDTSSDVIDNTQEALVESAENMASNDDEDLYQEYIESPISQYMSFEQFKENKNPTPVSWSEAESLLYELKAEEYDFETNDVDRFNSTIVQISKITAGLGEEEKRQFKEQLFAMINEQAHEPFDVFEKRFQERFGVSAEDLGMEDEE